MVERTAAAEVGLRIWDPLPDGLRTQWGEWSRWAAIKKKKNEVRGDLISKGRERKISIKRRGV